VENSCRTEFILTELTATPGKDDSKTRLSEFPSVIPYPRSSGSTTNLPKVKSEFESTHSILGFSISIKKNPPSAY
jgi:hypothetical protein